MFNQIAKRMIFQITDLIQYWNYPFFFFLYNIYFSNMYVIQSMHGQKQMFFAFHLVSHINIIYSTSNNFDFFFLYRLIFVGIILLCVYYSLYISYISQWILIKLGKKLFRLLLSRVTLIFSFVLYAVI